MTSDFDFSNEEWNLIINECFFTDIQKRIVELKRKGMADIDVAMELNLSRNTVLKHKLKACDKIIKLIKTRI